MEKIIVLDGFLLMSDEEREFVDNLKLSSDDMLEVFRIVVAQVLGMKIIKWRFDSEECKTRIWFE